VKCRNTHLHFTESLDTHTVHTSEDQLQQLYISHITHDADLIPRPTPTSFPSVSNPAGAVEPEPNADQLDQWEADLLENL
jgi:hypothetical protein